MYDKRFEIPRNAIDQDSTVTLPVMPNKGILAI